MSEIAGSRTCCTCEICNCGPDCKCPKQSKKDEREKDRETEIAGSRNCCTCEVCQCGPNCKCPKQKVTDSAENKTVTDVNEDKDEEKFIKTASTIEGK